MPNTPNTPPPSLVARVREILHGRSKYALGGGAALLAAVIVAGAMSRYAPPAVTHAAPAAPARPVAAAVHPAAPPAQPAVAPAVSTAAPEKPAAASTAAVAQTPAQPTGIVSAAMPKPPKLIAARALETTYDLSSAGAWVQTSSASVALPRSSFVVHASGQATRTTWAAWFKVSKPTTVLAMALLKGTDGDVTVAVDGFRAFHVTRSAFSLTPRATLVSPLQLAKGWHELAVTYSRKWGWQRSAQITIAAGDGVAAPALLDLNTAPVATAPTSARASALKTAEVKP